MKGLTSELVTVHDVGVPVAHSATAATLRGSTATRTLRPEMTWPRKPGDLGADELALGGFGEELVVAQRLRRLDGVENPASESLA